MAWFCGRTYERVIADRARVAGVKTRLAFMARDFSNFCPVNIEIHPLRLRHDAHHTQQHSRRYCFTIAQQRALWFQHHHLAVPGSSGDKGFAGALP